MKKIIVLFLFCLTLVSYKYATPVPAITGTWVNEKYINEVKTGTYSEKAKVFKPGWGALLKAQLDGLMFVFHKQCIKSSGFIFNFHEGCNDFAYYPEKNGYYFKNNCYDGDTVQHIRIIGNNKMAINGKIFIKISDDTTGEYQVLESILFKGNYIMDNGKQVTFTLDDHIIGLDTLTNYYPMIDYIDIGLNIDQVLMGSSSKRQHQTHYGFKFHKDSLYLYSLRCKEYDTADHVCALVEWDKLLYKMAKKK